MTDRKPTVRRNAGLSGPAGMILAVSLLGIAELAIIGVLIVLPVLAGEPLGAGRVVLCAVLLAAASAVFAAVSLVKRDGRWGWRWAR